ncbi:GSCOCG00002460001-RA-CDS, partial [Cotesia congregata]
YATPERKFSTNVFCTLRLTRIGRKICNQVHATVTCI